MTDGQAPPSGPDLATGVALSEFTGETLLGHVGDRDVLLVRSGSEIFAIDAHCSHYHGPLAEGLVVGDSIRCPWHHACFDLRSGEATRAPALNALAVWQVEHEGGRIFVRQERDQSKPRGKAPVDAPGQVVIVGGGAAGFAAAEMLRRQEFGGNIVIAEPVRLPIPGANQPHVHVLRSLADCRAIIDVANGARLAIVIGASFIGLEAAAALRAREIEVHVVAPEQRPMERVLGPDMGDFVRALHEEHGVIFHLGDTVAAIDGKRATLKSGGVLEADVVVIGVGVRPRLALAEQAGLELDRGVAVDAFLETSIPGIYAAGDIARWPDPHSQENIRVEHWVVAERQGQAAARNMLGQREAFDAVPFFWSQHYDVPINYVGHAEQWDEIAIDGDIAARDCLLQYKSRGRVLALASIYRDLASLQAELEMERKAVR